VEHTFTITNSGSAALSLTGASPYVTVTGSDFSITGTPSNIVAAGGGTTTFRVSFDPSTAGAKTATVSVANNDADENPYTFSIQGQAISAPVLTTSAAGTITGTGATMGGNVTADGGAAVTGRGVVYSTTNTAPIIGGANVTQDTNGSGTGVFSEAINGLAAATHYYFQAYAVNSEGTTYGGVEEFTTLNAVSSIARAGSNPTNAASVSWTVTFGANISSLTASNFSLANTGLTGPSITGVTGSGTTWTVSASTGTGSGSLGLNLANDTGLSAPLSNAPFTGEVYTIDRDKPTVTIEQAVGQADPAGSAPVNFTVTFNENVTGFATGDVTLSTSTTPGTLAGTVTGGPAVYNVAVNGMTGDGVVIASIPAGAAQDAAGNTSAVSSSTDNSVAYDAVAPGVTINQATSQIDPVNAGPIHFTAVFTESVTGFASGDVTLTSALAGLTQTITESGPMNGTTYDVSVGGLSGSGTVTASIASGAATDVAAHGNTASTSTDNTVTFDAAAPETSIDSHPASSTTSTSATFTFSATDAGTGVASYACDLDGGGFNTCTSPRNLSGISGGPHTFQVRATDVIGNIDSTPASFTWTVDASAPSVTTFTVTSPSTSRNIPVTDFTVWDDIGVTGFMVTTSSTAPAAGSASWAALPPATFTVAADGSYTLYPWVKDAAGRVSAVFGTPRSVTVDATAPSVTINQAVGQADPVKAGPVTFTVVFSEPVTGFDAADLSLFGSTVAVSILSVSGGPTTYTIIADAGSDGVIVLSIPTGGGLDAYSNPSADSTSIDNSITIDKTSPTVFIDSTTPDPTNTGAAVTWHSDENGTFSVRTGGTTCANGAQAAGGTYSTSPATINSTIPSANLAAGPNNLMVCVTDAAGNTGQMIGVIQKVLTPIVTTNAATPVGNTTATLRGTVNANGVNTAVQFQYGLTNTYGTNVNASPASVTGSSNSNVSAALTGLTANTLYHYRVTATNVNGTTDGTDQTFTTTDLAIGLSFHDMTHAVVTSATIGTDLHVSATVTHSNPAAPTGSLVFTRYNNVSCYGTGTAAGTVTMAATVDLSQSATLTGNGLSFKARYAGDSNYPAVESACASISDSDYPSVLSLSTGTVPRNGAVVSGGPSSLVVQFNEDVFHVNTTPPDNRSVLNPANFLLASRTTDDLFATVSCLGGIAAGDTNVPVDSVSYNAVTYTATISVNGGTRLPPAYYRLFVCGTTSIADLAGTTYLNNHTDDSLVSFRVTTGSGSASGSSSSDPDETDNIKHLPATGFTPGKVTILPEQTTLYSEADNLRLEIPRLGLDTSIVGVPVSNDGAAWDVTWLGSDAGWLNGTAFPSFEGNSVITGHVWGADNRPGIFVGLKDLAYGDTVIIHAYGHIYTYEVRETRTAAPDAVRNVIQHKNNPWVTLVTCEDYLPGTTDYASRRVVSAVLVNVAEE
jgi:LPXTG-site transpeptidase (sortase) family protein